MTAGITPPSKLPNATLAATEWNNSVRHNYLNGPLGLAAAAGDLFIGAGPNDIERLPKGSNNQVLKVSGGNVTWGAPVTTFALQVFQQGGFEDDAPETEQQAGNNVICTLPSGWDGMWVITDALAYWSMVANRATYSIFINGNINVTNDDPGPLWISTHAVDQSQSDRRMTAALQQLMFTDQQIIYSMRHQLFDGSAGDARFTGYYWRFLKFRTFN